MSNKGMSILMLFACVFVIGILVIVTYHLVERPQRVANMPQGMNELIKQLDKTIDSVKAKAQNIEPLNFEITSEAEAHENEALFLSGILWSGVDSLAIINKKIVGITDKMGDCWVTDIQENSVKLRCQSGEEKTLRCY
jgi:predicted PurR-regulated permease PerM